nr:putative cytokinetic ring protein SteA [Caldalkalibacillus mannanilyticus]
MKPQIYAQEQYGPLFFGPKTKELVKWLPFGSYALLDHEDIDEMAALSLIQKKVKGVLNYSSSMTGEYPSIGTQKLIQAHIPVYDVQDIEKLKSKFQQGNLIRIVKNRLWIDSMPDPITLLIPYTEERMELKMRESSLNIRESLKSFTENTLDYAYREMNEILKPIQIPPLRIHLRNRHVLVVTRGSGYMEDLKALTGYIQEKSPVLIGVDGGADAILECGYQPDMIIGDMIVCQKKLCEVGRKLLSKLIQMERHLD